MGDHVMRVRDLGRVYRMRDDEHRRRRVAGRRDAAGRARGTVRPRRSSAVLLIHARTVFHATCKSKTLANRLVSVARFRNFGTTIGAGFKREWKKGLRVEKTRPGRPLPPNPLENRILFARVRIGVIIDKKKILFLS